MVKFTNPKTGKDIIVKDAIADAFLQQRSCCVRKYDVIAAEPERRLHL